ncbi:DUF4157 domain-containing protein [Streptomyces sp. NPDC059786]|uniref:eCIS core domain-containing protein n=1 Tax=Streptomyces sp. NPDC059786 TaxID=3346946 RepID=UPI00365D5765
MREQRQSDPERSPGPVRRPAAARPRVPAPGERMTPGQVLGLQGLAGNAAVVQRLAADGGQDRHQHDASCGHGTPVQRSARDGEQDRHQHDASCGHGTPVQRSAVTEVLSTPGQPFAGPLRTEMEARFGAGLSHLRVHTDTVAQRSAAEIGAEAYTSGAHMVFTPSALAKKNVVAHEIAHTFDQAWGPVPGTDRGDGLRISDPGDAGERAAEATAREVMSGPVPSAATPVQTSRTDPAGAAAPGAAVQRMYSGYGGYGSGYGGGGERRSGRSATAQDSERRRRAEAPQVDSRRRTRAGAASRDDEADPMTIARSAAPPRRGPDGEALWDGTRRQLTWTAGTEALVLGRTPHETSSRSGRTRYECEHCQRMVLSRGEADDARENNWYEIDHIEGILAYVHRSVDPIQWDVEVVPNIYRRAEAILLEDAREAASDPDNLRLLCRRCNGGQRAANSESRHMDRMGPTWVGQPREVTRRSASPRDEPRPSRRDRDYDDYDDYDDGGGYGSTSRSGGYGGYGGYGGATTVVYTY